MQTQQSARDADENWPAVLSAAETAPLGVNVDWLLNKTNQVWQRDASV